LALGGQLCNLQGERQKGGRVPDGSRFNDDRHPLLHHHVNDGPNITLNLSGGSSNLPFPTTIPVRLNAGMNSIEFGNPTSYPPTWTASSSAGTVRTVSGFLRL